MNGIEGDVGVGFIPGGGTSVLSRALGLPRDPVQAARVLADRAGSGRSRSDGSRRRSPASPRSTGGFSSPPGSGSTRSSFARWTVKRPLARAAGRAISPLRWLLTKLLRRAQGSRRARLTVVGRGRAAFALVANCDPYTYAGPVPLHVAPGASFELGLDLAAPAEIRPGRGSRRSPLALARPEAGAEGLDRCARTTWTSCIVECDGPTPLQADGEDLGDVTAVTFRAERDALRVLVAG